MTQVSCNDNLDVLSDHLKDATDRWNHKNNSKDNDVKLNCTLTYIPRSEATSHWMKVYFPELIDVPESNNNPAAKSLYEDDVPESNNNPAAKSLYEETAICRQDSKEKNSDVPDHEHLMPNTMTDTSHSDNPPCKNDERLPELPLKVPVFPEQEMVEPSVHESGENSESDLESRKKKKTSSNHETKSASKHKSTKKRKTSSKSNNTFDVFGDHIDCSKFDKFFNESKVDPSMYPWVERRHVRKG